MKHCYLVHSKMWRQIAVFLLFYQNELSLAYNEVRNYKAAVVEFNPSTADTPAKTIINNLAEYRKYTQDAKNQSADIIVFPEYGLTTMVSNPENYSVEIDTTTPLIKELSALAKQQNIYLVVNLLEKVEKKKKIKYYNTNVVFDRSGTLILKYRKINLFGEPNLEAGSQNQNLTFRTDFGVTFATFTCFDILYNSPSRTILENGIKDVAYPTSWFSTLPFYSSLNVQIGYSISANVNLLAANIGDPSNTHGGSGIYFPDSSRIVYGKAHITDKSGGALLVEEIVKTPTLVHPGLLFDSSSDMSSYATLRDFRASDYNFTRLDLSQKNSTTEICYKKFCCTFRILLQDESSDFYKVMAYDGVVPFDVSTAHIRVCSLLVCANKTNDSCGSRIKSSTKFKEIIISGNLEKDSTTFYNPVALNYYLRPLKNLNFRLVNNGTSTSYIEMFTFKQRDLLAFGIFGRAD